MLHKLARGVKDSALGLSFKTLLNDKFSDYGEVKECSIDTHHNKLTIKAKLKGEHESVTATVERYELEHEGDAHYIVLRRFSSSREWLGLLLSKMFTDKRYKLPTAVTKLL